MSPRAEHTATVCVADGDRRFYDAVMADEKSAPRSRSSYSVEHTEGTTRLTATANDGVALRAVLTSISKHIIVFEKMRDIGDRS